jgi:flagellar protein FlbD
MPSPDDPIRIMPGSVRLFMIHVTRINHLPLVLNSDLIEHLESTPDTVITLTNGQKLVVRESVDEVVKKVIEFRRSIQVPNSPPDPYG